MKDYLTKIKLCKEIRETRKDLKKLLRIIETKKLKK